MIPNHWKAGYILLKVTCVKNYTQLRVSAMRIVGYTSIVILIIISSICNFSHMLFTMEKNACV